MFSGDPRLWIENCEYYFEIYQIPCQQWVTIASMHKQYGSVESYQEKFEELRTQLLCHNPQLTEEHFISCYISALREDLIPFLDIAHPNTLEKAYSQANCMKGH